MRIDVETDVDHNAGDFALARLLAARAHDRSAIVPAINLRKTSAHRALSRVINYHFSDSGAFGRFDCAIAV